MQADERQADAPTADAVVRCATCAIFERVARDPERRNRGAAASIYLLVVHHARDHDTPGKTVEGCSTCDEYEKGPRGIHPRLAATWGRWHGVEHALGIVSDGPGTPLRFADMAPLPPTT